MAPRTKVSLWCPFYRWGDQSRSYSEEVMNLKCKPMWSDFRTFFFKFFFNVDHFKSLYWICYNITSALCFEFLPWGMRKLSSQTRDWTHTLEGKVLTTGCPGKNPELILRNHYIRQILSRVLDARDAIVQKKKRGKKQTLKLFLEQRAGQCGWSGDSDRIYRTF